MEKKQKIIHKQEKITNIVRKGGLLSDSVKMSSADLTRVIKTYILLYSELQCREQLFSALFGWILKMQFCFILSEINMWGIGPNTWKAVILHAL